MTLPEKIFNSASEVGSQSVTLLLTEPGADVFR